MTYGKKSVSVADLQRMLEAVTASADPAAAAERLASTLRAANAPVFNAEVTSFVDDRSGKAVFGVNVKGTGFRAKYLSPNLVLAICENLEAVKAAAQEAKSRQADADA